MKTIRDMAIGAIMTFCAVFAAASYATIGNAPVPGQSFALQDSTWLLALANGSNYGYQNGISAAGTTQAAATALPTQAYLVEVDTASGSATGVYLPFCSPGVNGGQQLVLYNNTATGLTIYPNPTNNPVTSAQDTINNTTSASLAGHTQTAFACMKNGVWSSS